MSKRDLYLEDSGDFRLKFDTLIFDMKRVIVPDFIKFDTRCCPNQKLKLIRYGMPQQQATWLKYVKLEGSKD